MSGALIVHLAREGVRKFSRETYLSLGEGGWLGWLGDLRSLMLKWQLLYISSNPESLSWLCVVAVSSLLLAVSKHASDKLLLRLKLKFLAATFPLLAALNLGLGLLRHLLPFPPLLNCELAGCSGETLRARVVVPSDVVSAYTCSIGDVSRVLLSVLS